MSRFHIASINPRLTRILISSMVLICGCFSLLSCSRVLSDEPSLSTVRFHYESPISGQAQLVWGIDKWQFFKWQFADEEYRPQGTYIKDDLMYSPMTRQGDVYTVDVSLPKGTKIRYGFELFEDKPKDTDGYWDGDAAGILLLEKPEQEIYAKSTITDPSFLSRQEDREPFPDYTSPSLRNLIFAPTTATGLSSSNLIFILVVLFILITAVLLRKINPLTFALLTILLIGAVLRILWIEQPFVDLFGWRQSSVAMMAENYFKINGNILYPEVNWSGPGPNYQGREFQTVTYLAAILYRFLGQQGWIGRLIAVVFGVWGIFALYNLVTLVWDKKAAIIAAAIMAIPINPIYVVDHG